MTSKRSVLRTLSALEDGGFLSAEMREHMAKVLPEFLQAPKKSGRFQAAVDGESTVTRFTKSRQVLRKAWSELNPSLPQKSIDRIKVDRLRACFVETFHRWGEVARESEQWIRPVVRQLLLPRYRSMEDDLVQEALIWISRAALSFDETRGARFRTYAHQRIRGIVLDKLKRKGEKSVHAEAEADLLGSRGGSPIDNATTAPSGIVSEPNQLEQVAELDSLVPLFKKGKRYDEWFRALALARIWRAVADKATAPGPQVDADVVASDLEVPDSLVPPEWQEAYFRRKVRRSAIAGL